MTEYSCPLDMISSLADLETRRKLLFADDDFTVRSLGHDAILVTANLKQMSRHSVDKVRAFLNERAASASINSLIIDISHASFVTLAQTLAFSKLKQQGCKRFAVLSRKFRLQLLLPFLVSQARPTHFRLFKDLSTAIAWIRNSSTDSNEL